MSGTLRVPSEFEIISRYFAPLAAGFRGAFALSDDAAVIRPAAGHDLVVKTDAVVGGIHFLLEDPPSLIGRKALRVNLSYLAAKGAVPRAYVLDLMLPPDTEEAWVRDFARGLAVDQDGFGVHLIGGDTDSTTGPIAIAITALGEVAEGRMIRRNGARPGDVVHVTGTIGDAALGLGFLRGAFPRLDSISGDFLSDRYRLPPVPVTLGPRLIDLATASIDVSDGLIADLRHLCRTSGAAAVIRSNLVPLSSAARSVIAEHPTALRTALSGGDDYQILFTAPSHAEPVLATLGGELRVPITAIGHIVAFSGQEADRVSVVDAEGRALAPGSEGWTHF